MGVAAHALPPVSPTSPQFSCICLHLQLWFGSQWFLPSSLLFALKVRLVKCYCYELEYTVFTESLRVSERFYLSALPSPTTTLLYSSVWSAHLRCPLRSASLRPFSTTFTLAFLRGFISAHCSALPCLLRLLIRYKAAICHIVLPVWENIYMTLLKCTWLSISFTCLSFFPSCLAFW